MTDEDGSYDPYTPENIQIIQYITLARIYDVLMAMLTIQDKNKATQLLELHAQGKLLGPTPEFDGSFITDIMNKND